MSISKSWPITMSKALHIWTKISLTSPTNTTHAKMMCLTRDSDRQPYGNYNNVRKTDTLTQTKQEIGENEYLGPRNSNHLRHRKPPKSAIRLPTTKDCQNH